MNKKKAIKVLGASAIAASAFVATSPSGADAASAKDVQSFVKAAKDAGTVLKWAISTEGSADGTTRPWAQYNAAKAARDKAVAAINTLPAAQKAGYLADIEQNVNLHINRTMSYIDAITAGEKINVKKAALEAQIAKNLIDDNTEAAYHALSTEIRKQAILLDRVYGQTTRDEIRANYKKAAETVRDSVKYEVSAKIELDLAKKAIAANDTVTADKHLTEAAKYMKDVKNATMKASLVKVMDELEGQMTPAVKSVSAVNGKQLVISFTQPIEADSVITTPGTVETVQSGVITLTRTSTVDHTGTDVNIATATGKLSEDKKTFTITAATGETFEGSYDVAIKNVVSKEKTIANYYNKFEIADKTAPTVTGVIYNPSTNKFEVTLSEPVDAKTGEVVRVNNTPVSFDAVSAPTNKLTFGRPAGVELGSNVDIYIAGIKDAAGNLLVANTSTVSVTKDESALAVASINQIANNKIRVVFNKKLNSTSNTAILAKTGLVVTKNDGSTTSNFAVAAAPSTVDPDGLAYDITLTDATFTNKTTESFTLTFVKDAFTDVTNNKSGLYTQSISLTKDEVAPTVSTTRLSADGETIEVTLSEDIVAAPTSGVKLRKDGAELTGVTAQFKTGTKNVLLIDTTDTTALTSGKLKDGSYQVRFEAAAFADINGVDNKAVNAPVVTVKAAPAEALNATIATATGSGVKNTFTITAPSGKTFTSGSLAYTNFTIDGQVIDSNSDITLNPARNEITVKLPANETVKFTGSALFAATGLALETGDALNAPKATVSVVDNTAPKLTSAQLVSANVIKLTFDENLGSISLTDAANLVDDVQISNGTVSYNAGKTGLDITGDALVTSIDGKSIVITVTPDTDSNWSAVVNSSQVTVKTLDTANTIVDTNSVVAKSNLSVNLSK